MWPWSLCVVLCVEGLLSLVQWQCHQSLCQMLYDSPTRRTQYPIPPCPEDTHPLHVFEETHVDLNLYRWVAVCLMVKSPPESVAMVSNHSKGASQHHPSHTDLVG